MHAVASSTSFLLHALALQTRSKTAEIMRAASPSNHSPLLPAWEREEEEEEEEEEEVDERVTMEAASLKIFASSESGGSFRTPPDET